MVSKVRVIKTYKGEKTQNVGIIEYRGLVDTPKVKVVKDEVGEIKFADTIECVAEGSSVTRPGNKYIVFSFLSYLQSMFMKIKIQSK